MSTDEKDWDRLRQAIRAARSNVQPKRARFARDLEIDDTTLQILEGSRRGRPSEAMLDFVTGRLGWPPGLWRSILEGEAAEVPAPTAAATTEGATLSGVEIKRLREARGVSPKQLATALGVSPRAIGQWETGTTVPKERMEMLREFFGLDVSDSADPIRSASEITLLAELMRRAAAREAATG